MTQTGQLLTTKYQWSDLILNSNSLHQLNELSQCTDKNERCLALFFGPPGTGKSLAAALLGKRLQREVYHVSLSQIESKYIGETEKNLELLFRDAERMSWILFFDEADALFGKRTDVKHAHDKYANQEVSYLLQRITDYDGIAILATNFRNNIDDAFIRRLRFVIEFPIPGPRERLQLWKKGLTTYNLAFNSADLNPIAKTFDLSGSAIMQVTQRISEQAASDGRSLTIEKIRSTLAKN